MPAPTPALTTADNNYNDVKEFLQTMVRNPTIIVPGPANDKLSTGIQGEGQEIAEPTVTITGNPEQPDQTLPASSLPELDEFTKDFPTVERIPGATLAPGDDFYDTVVLTRTMQAPKSTLSTSPAPSPSNWFEGAEEAGWTTATTCFDTTAVYPKPTTYVVCVDIMQPPKESQSNESHEERARIITKYFIIGAKIAVLYNFIVATMNGQRAVSLLCTFTWIALVAGNDPSLQVARALTVVLGAFVIALSGWVYHDVRGMLARQEQGARN